MRTEDYIADNIIALCKKRDMSKYRLSQLTGISQSSIGKIIAKESLPTMPTVEKICDALGVTMAQFFAGMDVPVSLSESQQEVLNIWNNLDAINEQISNFAQTYPTNLKASSNEALLFMRRYRFANCSCFSCCFKDAYPSSNVQ